MFFFFFQWMPLTVTWLYIESNSFLSILFFFFLFSLFFSCLIKGSRVRKIYGTHAFCVFAYCLCTNGPTNRKKYNLPARSKERREREYELFLLPLFGLIVARMQTEEKVQFFLFYRSFIFQVLIVTWLKFSHRRHRRHHSIYIYMKRGRC
jgi:hypothetical protein